MSVYIKGFPLPNNCGACPLRLAWCRERIYMVTRPERCPIVPVPDHGDLIDYDFCLENYELLHDDDGNPVYAVKMRDINRAPTIIPASGGRGMNELPEDFKRHMAENKRKSIERCARVKKPMTNGDFIRAMTDGELAQFFHDCVACDDCPVGDRKCKRAFALCKNTALAWLKSPVEVDE